MVQINQVRKHAMILYDTAKSNTELFQVTIDKTDKGKLTLKRTLEENAKKQYFRIQNSA